MHSAKNKKNGHEKQKQNLNIYKDIVPNPTIKIRKRDWGLTIHTEVLNNSRAQRLLIFSETSNALTFHVTGHLMLSKAETMHPKQTNQINKIQVL